MLKKRICSREQWCGLEDSARVFESNIRHDMLKVVEFIVGCEFGKVLRVQRFRVWAVCDHGSDYF